MEKKQRPDTGSVLDFVEKYVKEKFKWRIIPDDEGYSLKGKFNIRRKNYPGKIEYAGPTGSKDVYYRIGFEVRKKFEKDINELKKELEKKFSNIEVRVEIKK